jgi:hypothetical protein
MAPIVATHEYLYRLGSFAESAQGLQTHGFITQQLNYDDLLLKRRCSGCNKCSLLASPGSRETNTLQPCRRYRSSSDRQRMHSRSRVQWAARFYQVGYCSTLSREQSQASSPRNMHHKSLHFVASTIREKWKTEQDHLTHRYCMLYSNSY